MKYFTICCFFFLVLQACKKESIDANTFDQGLEYYPIETGKYVVYAYDSIVYDNKGVSKYISNGFIKEEIGEQIENLAEKKQYKLQKYWKKNWESQWTLTDVETITSSNANVVKTEENLPFIKMIFPNSAKSVWNGNALFDENIVVYIAGEPMELYQDWRYKIESKGNQIDIEDKTYTDIIEVLQVDNSQEEPVSIYNKRYSKEIYAKGIGMIRKEMRMYDSQKPQSGQPWESYAEKGFSLVQEIIEHN